MSRESELLALPAIDDSAWLEGDLATAPLPLLLLATPPLLDEDDEDSLPIYQLGTHPLACPSRS